jgi:hypothetical protein
MRWREGYRMRLAGAKVAAASLMAISGFKIIDNIIKYIISCGFRKRVPYGFYRRGLK